MDASPTASSSQAAISASYGLLKSDVDIPLRSSNVLLVGVGTWFCLDIVIDFCWLLETSASVDI